MPSREPPPPPPHAQSAEQESLRRLEEEMKSKGFEHGDVSLVVELMGGLPDQCEHALGEMQKLRREGYDRSKADWASWIAVKYVR
mmetsp:Transcript_12285/g.29687  ORF Transcript_12285/g.29687 Transcript_12285/m.29687 type:complete len:85 (+) Transcript_12285:1-255(+)